MNLARHLAAVGVFCGLDVAVTNAPSAPPGPAASRNAWLSEAAVAVNVPLKPSPRSALTSAPPDAAEPVQSTKSGFDASAAFAAVFMSALADRERLQADELRRLVDQRG